MGASQFIAISSLSGRCKTSYRTLKPFQMPSRTFRQSPQRSRRAAARRDRPARTIGRFFRVRRCFSAQVAYPYTGIDYSPAGTTSATGPRAAICCRSIKDRCRRLKRHPQAATDGQLATHLAPFATVVVRGGFGSKSAVPSTTEHSRSTFNCGRTVTLPSRPEVTEPQNRKLEAVNRRRTETPSKTALCRGCCSEIPERRRNMRPNAQLFRRRRSHDHQLLARALCKQRSCSNAQ